MPSVKSQREVHRVSEVIQISGPFNLEAGASLSSIEIAYTTQGTLNKAKDNVVWVFHALTGNAQPEVWWPGLIGPGSFFDPKKYFIVCANVLGSCYGTTGPTSIDSSTGNPYLNQFPLITVKDMVKVHQLLKQKLRIEKIKIGIGGSLGGQQLLEWAAAEPEQFEYIIPIATNAKHSAWGIAFNETQRMALKADKSFMDGNLEGGKAGLQAARAIAMISYRTIEIYDKKQTDHEPVIDNFTSSSYQQYQGLKLSNRFSAHSYYTLSKAMDSHNIGRERESIKRALNSIKSKAIVIGIKSDLLFPVAEQEFIAQHIENGRLFIIDSLFGHDGFLIETQKLTDIFKKFL